MCYLLPAKGIFALAQLVVLHQRGHMGFIDLFNHTCWESLCGRNEADLQLVEEHLTCSCGEVRWGSRSSLSASGVLEMKINPTSPLITACNDHWCVNMFGFIICASIEP